MHKSLLAAVLITGVGCGGPIDDQAHDEAPLSRFEAEAEEAAADAADVHTGRLEFYRYMEADTTFTHEVTIQLFKNLVAVAPSLLDVTFETSSTLIKVKAPSIKGKTQTWYLEIDKAQAKLLKHDEIVTVTAKVKNVGPDKLLTLTRTLHVLTNKGSKNISVTFIDWVDAKKTKARIKGFFDCNKMFAPNKHSGASASISAYGRLESSAGERLNADKIDGASECSVENVGSASTFDCNTAINAGTWSTAFLVVSIGCQQVGLGTNYENVFGYLQIK